MLSKHAKIRVLHIITNLPVGGAQDNTLLTVQKLDRERYDVTLMCSPAGLWRERAETIPDLRLVFIKQLTRRVHPFLDLIAFWRMYGHMRRQNYDIVHTHSSKPGVLGRIAARLAGVPVIVHTIHGFPFHDFMPAFLRSVIVRLERLLNGMTDKIVTVSTLNRDKAIALGLAPPQKLVNIYSGIQFNRFDVTVDVEQKRKDLGIVNGEKIVGMVGRLSTQKAPLNFIRAIPGVIRANENVRFVLVGDGELRGHVQRELRRLGVQSKTTLLGYRSDVPEILQVLDVFVQTSLWEGLGRSLTEAMYSSRPVVATSVEGVPELVEDGETGILVPPDDPDSVAGAIIKLLQDPEKARRFGKAARARITREFQAGVMVRQIEKLYSELLRNSVPSEHYAQVS